MPLPHPQPMLRQRVNRLQAWLWGEPGAEAGTPAQRVVRTLLLTLEGFLDKHMQVHAASLSFYLLLSVVPFLAFLFLILQAFQVQALMRAPLLRFLAGGNVELTQRVGDFIEQAQSGLPGGVGILTTFVVGFVLLQRVKMALNVIWEVENPPGYRSRLIEYVTVLAVIPLLLTVVFGVTAFLNSEQVQAYLRTWVGLAPVWMGLANASSYAVMWLVTYYAYTFLPDVEVRWYAGLVGTLVAGSALVAAQDLYVVSLFQLTRQNVMYGALALLPTLMLWFYLAWMIFLFGAQLSCVVQRFRVFLERRRDVGGLGASEAYLAVMALVALQRRFVETGRPVPLAALAERLRQPRSVVEAALGVLAGARLVLRLPDARAFYLPMERLEQVSVADALERAGLLPALPLLPRLAERLQAEPLLALYREANRLQHEPLAHTTVGVLAEGMAPTPLPGAAPAGHPVRRAEDRPGAEPAVAEAPPAGEAE